MNIRIAGTASWHFDRPLTMRALVEAQGVTGVVDFSTLPPVEMTDEEWAAFSTALDR